MTTRLVFLFTLLLCAGPLAAAESPAVPLLLGPGVCVPVAQYQAGIDVRGRPVAPADLPAQEDGVVGAELKNDADHGVEYDDAYVINLKVDMAQKLGLPAALPTGEVVVGRVERDSAGHLTFNGKPLSLNARELVSGLCHQAAEADRH